MNFTALKQKFSKSIELYNNINEDYLGLLAAGIAFYFLMAAFPALAAAISLYGIFSDPHFIEDQINLLSRFLPPEALSIFTKQITVLLKTSGSALGLSFVISTLFAVYSATKGVGALIKGLNIAYNRKETRGVIQLTLTGFILTLGLMIFLLAALSVIAILPVFFNIVEIPGLTPDIYLQLRWPLLFFTALLGLEVLYSFAPCHPKFKWRWMSRGSFYATLIWVTASSFFSLFVTNFGSYNETYGSISAIIILLLWFWMSAMIILLGAEINHVFKKSAQDDSQDEVSLKAGSESVDEAQKI